MNSRHRLSDLQQIRMLLRSRYGGVWRNDSSFLITTSSCSPKQQVWTSVSLKHAVIQTLMEISTSSKPLSQNHANTSRPLRHIQPSTCSETTCSETTWEQTEPYSCIPQLLAAHLLSPQAIAPRLWARSLHRSRRPKYCHADSTGSGFFGICYPKHIDARWFIPAFFLCLLYNLDLHLTSDREVSRSWLTAQPKRLAEWPLKFQKHYGALAFEFAKDPLL